MASVFLFVFFLLSHLPLLQSTEEEMRNFERCPPFSCGSLPPIGFPFAYKSHPECGPFTAECNNSVPWIRFGDGRRSYEVLEVGEDNVLLVRGDGFPKALEYPRCEFLTHLTIPSSSFFSVKILRPHNQTFFQCNSTSIVRQPSGTKTIPCGDTTIYYHPFFDIFPDDFSRCSEIQVPKNLSLGPNRLPNGDDLFSIVTPEFALEVHVYPECLECYQKGSQCKARTNGKHYCKKELTKKQNIVIGTSIVGVGVGVLLLVIFCLRRKLLFDDNIYCWKKKSLTHQTIQAFLRDHGHLAIKQYNYSDIKKITYSFKDKLGEGGYGSVYKGKLQDGCLVAVKVLKELKGNGEEFINEVASISRTSHVNIVSLMGFCFEHSKRALIYEFMPNGSLEKFIYKTNSSKDVHQLEWEAIYKIAIGIAQGLEYLHRGCNTRILHFDIKPHNILLDENFCPKISDFGLAKVCCREQSIVSILGARGTIGYIAPEVFCRSIGGISHKSDVYSYGMLILEMIGGRRNIEIDVGHTSEIFFPHWIHKLLNKINI